MKFIVSEENCDSVINSLNDFFGKGQTVSIVPISKKIGYRFDPFIGKAREHWRRKEDHDCLIAIGDKYEDHVTPVHSGDTVIITDNTVSYIPVNREFSRPKTWLRNRFSTEERRNHIRNNLMNMLSNYYYDSFDSEDYVQDYAKRVFYDMMEPIHGMLKHRDGCFIDDCLYGPFGDYNFQVKIHVGIDISSFGDEGIGLEDVIHFWYVPKSNAPNDFRTGRISGEYLPSLLFHILRRDFFPEEEEESAEDSYDPFEGDFSTIDEDY